MLCIALSSVATLESKCAYVLLRKKHKINQKIKHIVHQRVISAMEKSKAGKMDRASQSGAGGKMFKNVLREDSPGG